MISLDVLKKYLNLDSDFTEDDELLITILNGCENAIIAMCNGVETEDGFTCNENCLPERFDMALLMLCAEFYNNRELNIQSGLKESTTWNYIIIPLTKFTSF